MDNLIQHLNVGLSLTDTALHPNVDASSATKYLRCGICNQELSTKWKLRQHVMNEHYAPMLRFACTACEKSFRRSSDLEKHVARRHSIVGVHAPKIAACQSGHCAERLKHFHCTWPGCYASFSRSVNIKIHVDEVHVTLRRHACPVAECDRSFPRMRDLSRHIQADHCTPDALVMGPERQLETGDDRQLLSAPQETVSIAPESVSGPSE